METTHIRRLVQRALEDVEGYSAELSRQLAHAQEEWLVADLKWSIARAEEKATQFRAWLGVNHG